MQRALVVLDDIFYCSVGNGLDRSLQIGQGFCPFFHTIQIQNQNNRPPAGMSYSKQTGDYLRQYRIILSADTASEVRQMLSQKRR